MGEGCWGCFQHSADGLAPEHKTASVACRKCLRWKNVIDTVVVGSCGPPGGGRHDMSMRLTRHMLTLTVPPASELVMRRICSAVLGGFMDAYFTPGWPQHMLPVMCIPSTSQTGLPVVILMLL